MNTQIRPSWVQVEVDVALNRPPQIDARVWTTLAVQPEWRDIGVEAETVAYQMAISDPRVVMVVGLRVIDWEEAE